MSHNDTPLPPNGDKKKDEAAAPASESKALAPVHTIFPRFPSKEEWNTLQTIAQTFVTAGAMPKGIDTAPKLMVVLQAAREIGLSPIEGLNSLYFVNGKVAMYGEAVPMQIYRAGHRISWGKCDATEANVTITRGDTDESMTTRFTMEMAQERGYTSNPLYKKFPENMLKWRALSMTAKFICPDALKGIGIKEDMEIEVVEEGSKFHHAGDAARVKGEVESGGYNKRKSFKKPEEGKSDEGGK